MKVFCRKKYFPDFLKGLLNFLMEARGLKDFFFRKIILEICIYIVLETFYRNSFQIYSTFFIYLEIFFFDFWRLYL